MSSGPIWGGIKLTRNGGKTGKIGLEAVFILQYEGRELELLIVNAALNIHHLHRIHRMTWILNSIYRVFLTENHVLGTGKRMSVQR